MAEQSTHINYTFEDIQRYLQGNMSAAEMHTLEKAALQDPFLSDAIEGYREISSRTAQQHLNEINAALQQEQQDSKIISIKKNNQWLRIAAIIILLAGVGVLGTYFFKKSNNQSQIAQVKKEETKKQSPIKDSGETATTEAIPANKISEPVIVKNNKKKIHSIKKTKASNPSITAESDIEENTVASISVHPQQTAEVEKTFASLSAQKNNDSTQNFLQRKMGGLNVASANTFAGRVIDENNNPVVGAMVETNDKMNAVVTDLNGNFNLQKNDSILHVQATAVGYKNQNVSLQLHQLNLIKIEQNQTALNDVVVTRYGIKSKNSVNQMATPVGGWQNFNNYVITKLNEDSTKENYMLNNDIVELEFLVDDNGNPYDIKVTKPLDDKRNSKAIDILKSGPRWINPSKKKKAKVSINF